MSAQSYDPVLLLQADTAVATPFEWGAEDWQQLERERLPIFDDNRITNIDRRKFLEDGFVLLDGIMTDHGRRAWTAALQLGQQRRDAMIRENWITSIDWKSLFRPSPPSVRPTAKQIAEAEGCTQEPPGDESCGTTTLKNHGIFIDHFSAGHLPFLMDVMTHPQMLQLQRSLLGCEHVLVDHNSLLNRKAGYQGGAWHSHSMNSKNWAPMQDLDNGRPVAPEVYDQQPNFVLNLVYPEGFAAKNDGGLKFIPGSRQYSGFRARA